MGKFINLTGLRVDRLLVIDRAKNHTKSTRWNCVCDCGNRKIIHASLLKNGSSRNCGCLQKVRKVKHGCSSSIHRTSEYRAWDSMRSRCYREKKASYSHYGGRGIIVCDRWRNSFEAFFEDMGLKPSPQHSLDRIDNEGNYCKENCRWATLEEQASNKRPIFRHKKVLFRNYLIFKASSTQSKKQLRQIFSLTRKTLNIILREFGGVCRP